MFCKSSEKFRPCRPCLSPGLILFFISKSEIYGEKSDINVKQLIGLVDVGMDFSKSFFRFLIIIYFCDYAVLNE